MHLITKIIANTWLLTKKHSRNSGTNFSTNSVKNFLVKRYTKHINALFTWHHLPVFWPPIAIGSKIQTSYHVVHKNLSKDSIFSFQIQNNLILVLLFAVYSYLWMYSFCSSSDFIRWIKSNAMHHNVVYAISMQKLLVRVSLFLRNISVFLTENLGTNFINSIFLYILSNTKITICILLRQASWFFRNVLIKKSSNSIL